MEETLNTLLRFVAPEAQPELRLRLETFLTEAHGDLGEAYVRLALSHMALEQALGHLASHGYMRGRFDRSPNGGAS